MSELYKASFLLRVAAGVLDSIIVFTPILFTIFLITGDFTLQWSQGVIYNVPYLLYLTVMPTIWKGNVIGKRIVNIRIEKLNGESLKISDMIMREIIGKFILGYVTFGLTTIASALMVLIRKDKRAIHDLLAGTQVSS
ncbi:RDD family protein [Cytobacillus sp. FJAT-54145]|uniref:RDD family protein n=1 Tax=Cytobacillus spartinae TaxID=3299023 RepID=A0ABW6K6K2_9BACI